MKREIPSDEIIKALPKDGGDKFNRLIFESSIYLKSHAHQAIDWYPWGQMAFDLAKITNKPLFLSIGYSSCHWCHVMSDQTFDHPDVANALNQHFISIKIDRDQYPDLDQIYMNATQLMIQHGGWPNSVFCLPTGQPFYAGTYFPPDDQPGRVGFLTLLEKLAGAWKNNHEEIVQQAQELERVIQKMNQLQKDPHQSLQLRSGFEKTIDALVQDFDSNFGGLGVAPKFPPYAALRLLIDHAQHHDFVYLTLTKMALSGLYDQVEGGFHRYSTDQEWHLPHFEKMLIDNAQMIELYSRMATKDKDGLFKRVVDETITHLLRDWALPNGGFLATIDADSDGGEGHYYVIEHDELLRLADSTTVQSWIDYFQITRSGNMLDEATNEETGYNIFHPKSFDPSFDRSHFQTTLKAFRKTKRKHPVKDTTFSISSNAWLAKALVLAGNAFSNTQWVQYGNQLLDIVLTEIKSQLKIVYLDDVVYALSAVIEANRAPEDYIFLWDLLMDAFYDYGQGGLWYSQIDHRTPISRIKDIYDRAEPSSNGVFIACALLLYQKTNHVKYYERALEMMGAFMTTVMQSPRGSETYWQAIHMFWKRFDVSDLFSVQMVKCVKQSSTTIALEIDLKIADGHFLIQKDTFDLPDQAEWLQISIDPIKTRRMDWSQAIIQCATGSVRIRGRVRLDKIPEYFKLHIPICSETVCFEPVMLDIPITD